MRLVQADRVPHDRQEVSLRSLPRKQSYGQLIIIRLLKISHLSIMRGIFLPFAARSCCCCCWICSRRYGRYMANKILKDNTAHAEA